jgi:acyl dehydratase
MSWQPPAVGARATWTRTITADDVEAFARFSGDRNPLHFDPGATVMTFVHDRAGVDRMDRRG